MKLLRPMKPLGLLPTLLIGAALAIAQPAAAWDYQVTVNGNSVLVTIAGLTGNNCCGGASIDTTVFGGASCSQPCGGTQYATLGCNSVGVHVVYVYASDQSTAGYEYRQTSVTITDPPPPTCPQFDIIAGGPRVLTHKYGDSIGTTASYPQGQTTDGEMPIVIRTRAAPAGTVVNLKVVDPPDTAAYGTPHQNNDNVDTAAGTINGSKTASVTLPQAGAVNLVLKATQNAAGDNYAVEATTDPNLVSDPNFVCDPTAGCQSTGTVTAWKRWYIEYNEMYRNSLLLADRVLIGDSVVYVNERGFRKGDIVRLIHAPSYLRDQPQDVDGFYSEDRTIVDVGRNNNANQPGAYAVTLNAPLQLPYFTDLQISTTLLGDAIVDLSRNAQHSSDPAYHFNTLYVSSAFSEGFVEVLASPTGGVTLPLYNAMTDNDMSYVGQKWFAAREGFVVPANFGFAVAAEAHAPISSGVPLGTTTDPGPYSYVWRQAIDDTTAHNSKYLDSGLDPNIVSGEVLVHELAHQWQVNANYPNHECNKYSYANPALFCQGNGPQNSGQYGDGIIHFHYAGSSPSNADSEYVTIRTAAEPKP